MKQDFFCRSLNHGAAAAAYVKPAPRPIPSPSFAARPVWKGIYEAPQQSPEERRQVTARSMPTKQGAHADKIACGAARA